MLEPKKVDTSSAGFTVVCLGLANARNIGNKAYKNSINEIFSFFFNFTILTIWIPYLIKAFVIRENSTFCLSATELRNLKKRLGC